MNFLFVYRNSMRFYPVVKAAPGGMRRRTDEGTRRNVAVRAGLIAFILTAALCAGCTSAPIDMSAADPLEAPALDSQAALREQARVVVSRVETNGWSQSDDPADAARALLGRLIGGGGDEVMRDDAVARYLAAHEAPFRAAVADIESLSEQTRTLSRLAVDVASADGSLSQAGLSRDIAASESALGAVRRAAGFFEAVGREASLSEAEAAALSSALSALREAGAGLARGADALAERRWAARSGLFG